MAIATLWTVETFQDALICPIDRFVLNRDKGELICSGGHKYPVTNGIPRFTNDGYSRAFGYQWSIFRKTQFDSYTGTSISKNRLVEAFGEKNWESIKNSKVLEVGCGAGRFTEVLLEEGAKVFSVDLSLAVDVNKLNFSTSSNHVVLQADVANLPFKPETFNVVFCLGVIQHTPNPEETIMHLAEYVSPGHWLIIDHYGKSLSWYLRTAPLARAILKRLPHEKALSICQRIYFFAKPFYRKSRNRLYRKALNIIFPIVYFDNEIPELPDKFRDDWSLLDTFDSLTDWHKHRRSVAQIRGLLEKLNFEDIDCFSGGNGVVARARKKSS